MLNKDLRKRIVEVITRAKEGHIPSSFSIVDLIEHLYGHILAYDLNNPDWDGRDYFILSKGHGCAGLYVVLEKYGLLNSTDLDAYSQRGGILGGHPDATKVPFIEASTGSLGHGFPYSVGIALGKKIEGTSNKIIALLGDGECHEGTIWEAAHVAANQQLGNLTAIIDWNQSGAQLCPIDDLPGKWQSFGWDVTVFDGHDKDKISQAMQLIGNGKRPRALIAKNTKGKGVPLVEGHGRWHHRIPNDAEYKEIMDALS